MQDKPNNYVSELKEKVQPLPWVSCSLDVYMPGIHIGIYHWGVYMPGIHTGIYHWGVKCHTCNFTAGLLFFYDKNKKQWKKKKKTTNVSNPESHQVSQGLKIFNHSLLTVAHVLNV